eukprot:942089_1
MLTHDVTLELSRTRSECALFSQYSLDQSYKWRHGHLNAVGRTSVTPLGKSIADQTSYTDGFGIPTTDSAQTYIATLNIEAQRVAFILGVEPGGIPFRSLVVHEAQTRGCLQPTRLENYCDSLIV